MSGMVTLTYTDDVTALFEKVDNIKLFNGYIIIIDGKYKKVIPSSSFFACDVDEGVRLEYNNGAI